MPHFLFYLLTCVLLNMQMDSWKTTTDEISGYLYLLSLLFLTYLIHWTFCYCVYKLRFVSLCTKWSILHQQLQVLLRGVRMEILHCNIRNTRFCTTVQLFCAIYFILASSVLLPIWVFTKHPHNFVLIQEHSWILQILSRDIKKCADMVLQHCKFLKTQNVYLYHTNHNSACYFTS